MKQNFGSNMSYLDNICLGFQKCYLFVCKTTRSLQNMQFTQLNRKYSLISAIATSKIELADRNLACWLRPSCYLIYSSFFIFKKKTYWKKSFFSKNVFLTVPFKTKNCENPGLLFCGPFCCKKCQSLVCCCIFLQYGILKHGKKALTNQLVISGIDWLIIIARQHCQKVCFISMCSMIHNILLHHSEEICSVNLGRKTTYTLEKHVSVNNFWIGDARRMKLTP